MENLKARILADLDRHVAYHAVTIATDLGADPNDVLRALQALEDEERVSARGEGDLRTWRRLTGHFS